MLTNTSVMASIAVSDIQASTRFYQDNLGLQVQQTPMEGTVILGAGNGTNLQLYQKPSPRPSDNTCATFEVQNLEDAVNALTNNGVNFEEYDMPDIQTQGAVAILGTHKAAWFKDPDGNILCLHEDAS